MDTWAHGGIQQVGVGVHNLALMRDFYAFVLGFDTPLFCEEGRADLMSAYTGGRGWNRKAMLLANLHGGAALELWQHTEHLHVPAESEVGLDNCGILCACVRCRDIVNARNRLFNAGYEITRIAEDNLGIARCYIKDPEHNWIGLVETSDGWLKKKAYSIGGVCSVIIGVSDIQQSMHFYSKICGYNIVLYDEVGTFAEFEAFQGQQKIRRVLLKSSKGRQGAFAHLLQSSTIELIQACERQQGHVYENYEERFWGDPGFIHVCFDVKNMDGLHNHIKVHGSPFVVDSGSSEVFSMEEASGRFAYVEDADRTLIEFVEVYTLPLMKKYGFILNLKNRKSAKPLPKFLMRLLALKKISHKKF